MQLIDQHTKKIMETCKQRARAVGLSFLDETLEYIVSNHDMIRLSPKNMIPTLYDYWVNDVEVLKEEGRYRLYPGNPYETVINSRPAISFYNDNNPDWMNIMIFYHVLGHIDFFQNNILFENTWNDDFVGVALSDKRLIESLRSEYGRMTDYVIEFSRSFDNITAYYRSLPKPWLLPEMIPSDKISFYIESFLQDIVKAPAHDVFKEIERYNKLWTEDAENAESRFFTEVNQKYPEFSSNFEQAAKHHEDVSDILEFILNHSPFLKKDENRWMKTIVMIVRNTALYFAPQIRTKIINEGWASYWHDKLFIADERISGHESDYAHVNAGVTSLNRIGLNPYAIGLRLIQHVEELSDKGKLNFGFSLIKDIEQRNAYDKNTGNGMKAIFNLRSIFSDHMLINTFVDQDFVDKHNLFVTGKRFNPQRETVEYYIQSRKAEDYRDMLLQSLYHPPYIKVDTDESGSGLLYLNHVFEGKQLYKPYIADTLMAAEFLWGAKVQFETTNIIVSKDNKGKTYQRVLYTMENKKMSVINL